MDSGSPWQMGQLFSSTTPFLARQFFTVILLCAHIHKNVLIQGRVSTFQIQLAMKGILESRPKTILYALFYKSTLLVKYEDLCKVTVYSPSPRCMRFWPNEHSTINL